MGLDMYLYRKSYVLNSEWYKEEFREEIKMTRGGKDVDTSKIKYIVEQVGYWRKANAIHKWFVDKVQDGVDNCAEYTVTVDQLTDLLSTCKHVLDNRSEAGKVLPTQNGFFFGGTEYDEYYFNDIESTISILEDVLTSDADSCKFYYSSSW